MRRVIGVVLLVVAGVMGPLLSIPTWIALWDADRALWGSFALMMVAWFALPAAITAVFGAPMALWNGVYVAVASATSGAVGWCLTYVTFIAYGSAGLD